MQVVKWDVYKSSGNILEFKAGCGPGSGRMQEYLSQVRHLQSRFESFYLQHILRGGNTHANSLATLAISLAQSLPRVIIIEDLCKPTKMKSEVVHIHQIRVGSS